MTKGKHRNLERSGKRFRRKTFISEKYSSNPPCSSWLRDNARLIGFVNPFQSKNKRNWKCFRKKKNVEDFKRLTWGKNMEIDLLLLPRTVNRFFHLTIICPVRPTARLFAFRFSHEFLIASKPEELSESLASSATFSSSTTKLFHPFIMVSKAEGAWLNHREEWEKRGKRKQREAETVAENFCDVNEKLLSSRSAAKTFTPRLIIKSYELSSKGENFSNLTTKDKARMTILAFHFAIIEPSHLIVNETQRCAVSHLTNISSHRCLFIGHVGAEFFILLDRNVNISPSSLSPFGGRREGIIYWIVRDYIIPREDIRGATEAVYQQYQKQKWVSLRVPSEAPPSYVPRMKRTESS